MANSFSLASHWNTTRLEDQELFSIQSGIWTGKKKPFVDCFVVRNTDFTDDGFLCFDDVARLPIEERHLEKKRLMPGDIIIERSGGGPQQPVGRVAFFDRRDGNYCFSNFTARLRVNNPALVNPRFLHHFLLYFHLSGHTEMLQRRTTGIRNLAFGDYLKTTVPLPPIEEQRAIARALHTVQRAKEARQRELALERERKAALLEYLFTHGTRGEPRKQTEIGEIPESWRVERLANICPIRYGLGQPPEIDPHGIPMIRATDIRAGTVASEDVIRVKRDAIPRSRNPYLKRGDIIVVRSGAYTGDVAMYDGRWDLAVAGYDLVVSPDSDEIVPGYLAQYLLGETAQRYFLSRRDRAAQAHLNAQQLGDTLIPFPSHAEQGEIAGILLACDAKICQLKSEITISDELFRAMLEELMTGRLSAVPLIQEEATP